MRERWGWVCCLAVLMACSPAEKDTAKEVAEGPQFFDVTVAAGIDHKTVSGTPEKQHIVECNTGGTALFDYDNDGDLDIFFVNGSRLQGYEAGKEPRAGLFRNDGDWHFVNVAAAAGVDHVGWGMGATVADYDGDGYSDLYLANYGPNALYHNNGDGTFSNLAQELGVDYAGWSSAATFGDYDGDGDLDFYLTNYIDFDPDYVPSDMSFCNWRGINVFYGPRGMPGEADRLYRNEGEAKGWAFVDASAEFGVEGHDYYGFAALAGDYDNDGDLDIYIANDSTPNSLYRNDNGHFTDVALITASAYSEDGREQGGMGLASSDYDNDGDLDLFVTNFSHDNNTLYRNNGSGFFTDASFTTSLGKESITYLGWGTGFFDYDNDGDDDLFVANGHVYPAVDRHDLGTKYFQRNQLFESDSGVFSEVGLERGPGLLVEKSSRGHAFGDLDNDGDLDIVIVNIDDTPTVLRNDGGNNNQWLLVRLIGERANRSAVGARVIAEVGGNKQLREVHSGTGYISQDDMRLHFGLGQAEKVDRLVVRWPDGHQEVITDVIGNRMITIAYGRGIVADGFAVPKL
jgi:enediyne biosynthesis protein E4